MTMMMMPLHTVTMHPLQVPQLQVAATEVGHLVIVVVMLGVLLEALREVAVNMEVLSPVTKAV
jgi:hypothetical protein